VCEGTLSQVLHSCSCQTLQPALLPVDHTQQNWLNLHYNEHQLCSFNTVEFFTHGFSVNVQYQYFNQVHYHHSFTPCAISISHYGEFLNSSAISTFPLCNCVHSKAEPAYLVYILFIFCIYSSYFLYIFYISIFPVFTVVLFLILFCAIHFAVVTPQISPLWDE